MKKRLLIIGKLPPPYMGPSVAFELLINSDLRNRFELLHLDIKANDTLDTLGKFSMSKLRTNIAIYRKFSGLLKDNRPDIVLIPISQTTLGFVKDAVFILLCKKHNIRSVIQLRGSNFKKWADNASWPIRQFIKSVLKKPEGVIVLGNKLKYLFKGYFPDDRIFVVPNGGNFPVAPSKKAMIRPVTFIYLANLQATKGIEDILLAALTLQNQHQGDFRMLVAGQWRNTETRQMCEEIVSKNNLPVTFFPAVSGQQKFDFLASGDVFLFTPREPEGHPWVIIEAMSAGLALISTDQGAITESVIDGQNGFIVASRSPNAIAERMEWMIRNPDKILQMGSRSRELYEERFTEKRMVDNLTAVLNSVCS